MPAADPDGSLALGLDGLPPEPPLNTFSAPPADIYFSVAVVDNGHNHAGDFLVFLDFDGDDPGTSPAHRVVVAPALSAPLVLDGKDGDWLAAGVDRTLLRGQVQNNYPLSEYLDAVPTDILLGAAYDDAYVYFVAQWEDAGHSASVAREEWSWDGSSWARRPHQGPTAGAPNDQAVNRDHVLAGLESEDRLLFMFPIVDQQNNFADGGIGCARYCHANLATRQAGTYLGDDAAGGYTGASVAAMHTNLPADVADVWHWKASRSGPAGSADDERLVYRDQQDPSYADERDGRERDVGGQHAASDNVDGGGDAPAKMAFYGGMQPGAHLFVDQAVDLDPSAIAAGDRLPASLLQLPSGNRGNVQAYATYDGASHVWTVELRRLRDTGHPDDHAFVPGPNASAPSALTPDAPEYGDPAQGQVPFILNCGVCHGGLGEGVMQDPGEWLYPRNQRTSLGNIERVLRDVAPMSTFDIDPQLLPHLAAYLQSQQTPP